MFIFKIYLKVEQQKERKKEKYFHLLAHSQMPAHPEQDHLNIRARTSWGSVTTVTGSQLHESAPVGS